MSNMIPGVKENMLQNAIEVAKVVCANPNCKVQLNDESAKAIADFIKTLHNSLLEG